MVEPGGKCNSGGYLKSASIPYSLTQIPWQIPDGHLSLQRNLMFHFATGHKKKKG